MTSSASGVAIRAGQLIDGSKQRPIKDAVVLVKGKRIEAAGPAASVKIPRDYQQIDLSSETVLPGLIDTHGHLTYRYGARNAGGVSGLHEQAMSPGAQQMTYMIRNARVSLLCGVTTMRMVGDGTPETPVDRYIKAAIHDQVVPGPRIIDCGCGMTPTAGHGNPKIWTDGAEQLRARVRQEFYGGAEWVKILLIDASADSTIYSDEELLAIVDEAHRWRLKVTVHCTGRWGSSIKAAIGAGVDNIEHARPMTPEIIAMLAKSKIGVSLTPLVYVGFRPDHSTWQYMDTGAQGPADWIEYGRKQYFGFREAHPEIETEDRPYEDGELHRSGRDFFPSNATQQGQALAAFKAGVRISLGLDTVYYGAIGNVAEYLIEGGFDPHDAIRCATSEAARNIGYEERIGTIAPGMFADIISLRADPLKERWAWHKIHFVMKDGVRYDTLSWR